MRPKTVWSTRDTANGKASGQQEEAVTIDEKVASTRVVLQERTARPYIWIDVSYNGKYPPIDLFADLEMLGWRPPAPAPPPRSAIDWSTPDPATGDPFTILDYSIDDVIDAPPGAGDRGRWTDGERVAYLKGLDGVLRRHDLLAKPPPPTPPAAPPPPPAPAGVLPPPPAAAGGADPAGAPSPAGGELTAGETEPESSALLHLEAVLVPGTRSVAMDALTSLDVPARVELRERTKTVQFRGSSSTSKEMGHVLTAVVAASEISRVTAILVNANTVMNEDAITISGLRAEALASFLAPPTEPAPGAPEPPSEVMPSTAPSRFALVNLTLAATAQEYVSDVVGGAGGRITSAQNVQKRKITQHRGARRETTVPGVRSVIEVAPEQLDVLLGELRDCGVAVDDPDEVTVERPAAPPGTPAAAPLAEDAASGAGPPGATEATSPRATTGVERPTRDEVRTPVA